MTAHPTPDLDPRCVRAWLGSDDPFPDEGPPLASYGSPVDVLAVTVMDIAAFEAAVAARGLLAPAHHPPSAGWVMGAPDGSATIPPRPDGTGSGLAEDVVFGGLSPQVAPLRDWLALHGAEGAVAVVVRLRPEDSLIAWTPSPRPGGPTTRIDGLGALRRHLDALALDFAVALGRLRRTCLGDDGHFDESRRLWCRQRRPGVTMIVEEARQAVRQAHGVTFALRDQVPLESVAAVLCPGARVMAQVTKSLRQRYTGRLPITVKEAYDEVFSDKIPRLA